MLVDLADGKCRLCGGQLEVVGAGVCYAVASKSRDAAKRRRKKEQPDAAQ